jgi:hypothetical protein
VRWGGSRVVRSGGGLVRMLLVQEGEAGLPRHWPTVRRGSSGCVCAHLGPQGMFQ